MFFGKRKAYYSHTYDEIKLIKNNIIEAKKKGRLNEYIKGTIGDSLCPLVYFISDGDYCKIGATNNIHRRIKAFQTATPRKLKLLATYKCDNPFELEKFLHDLFKNKQVSGEWYDILNLFEVINKK